MWLNVKNELSAMPVMIPGSAIGRTSKNETDSRPKKVNRAIANAAADPRRSADPVASSAARTDSQRAARTSCEGQATRNDFVVKAASGQLWMLDLLTACTMMSASGRQTNSADHAGPE